MPQGVVRCFTDAEIQDVVARYARGASLRGLAAEYGCAPLSLRKILVANGVEIRTQVLANTPIELRLQNVLKTLGIGFSTQTLLLGHYIVDIEIHQQRIVLEADGADHLRPTQIAKDELRDVALTAAGYRVFRFTGSEINSDATRCIQQVVSACGLVPDAPAVYNIRTLFVGEGHPLWKGGKREFTCEVCGVVFLAQPKHRRGPHIYCGRTCFGIGRRGRPCTPEQRAKISAGIRGKKRKPPAPFTAEHRANLSAALTGKPKTAEHVANAAAALRGRTVSAETRAKISAAVKRYQANQIKI